MRKVSRRLEPGFIEFMKEHGGVDLSRQPLDDPRYWFIASVRDVNDEYMAAMAVEFLHDFDGFFTAVVVDQEALTRRLLKAIFATLFSRVVRLTATVDPGNKASIAGLKRLGFVYEGFMRRGLDGVRDAELYGLLAEDCRYLPGYAGGTIARAIATPVSKTAH